MEMNFVRNEKDQLSVLSVAYMLDKFCVKARREVYLANSGNFVRKL